MRKLALLVAAALVVSVPLLSTTSTESLGAAKAKAKAATEESGGFFRAFSDQLGGSKSDTGKKAKRPARKKSG